ncbi:hypothetical protein T484DRAFT_1794635 [Baffinella frigidus]|nr:hypothetical protein T484DRAFT_1794635 [Cryptophyta sp. CCMP2293]
MVDVAGFLETAQDLLAEMQAPAAIKKRQEAVGAAEKAVEEAKDDVQEAGKALDAAAAALEGKEKGEKDTESELKQARKDRDAALESAVSLRPVSDSIAVFSSLLDNNEPVLLAKMHVEFDDLAGKQAKVVAAVDAHKLAFAEKVEAGKSVEQAKTEVKEKEAQREATDAALTKARTDRDAATAFAAKIRALLPQGEEQAAVDAPPENAGGGSGAGAMQSEEAQAAAMAPQSLHAVTLPGSTAPVRAATLQLLPATFQEEGGQPPPAMTKGGTAAGGKRKDEAGGEAALHGETKARKARKAEEGAPEELHPNPGKKAKRTTPPGFVNGETWVSCP